MRLSAALFAITFSFIIPFRGSSQSPQHCGTVEYMQMLQAKDASLKKRLEQAEHDVQAHIKQRSSSAGPVNRLVPVVVHVLWHETYQNLCDDVVQSQIDVLNEDYSRTNADTNKTPESFKSLGDDSGIRFVLANRDPNGSPTDGITRTYIDWEYFQFGSDMKFDSTGGRTQWDPDSYLNIWVCPLEGSVLGYATLPSGSINPGEDGVVIASKTFGRHGYDPSGNYNMGRTTTHEVGHWLDLRHTWGDDGGGCSTDDMIDDTPIQADCTFGCPSFPQISCGNGPDGNMFMNYMDYTDDRCMNIFTKDQITHMQSTLDVLRPDILISPGYVPDSTKTAVLITNGNFTVVPNPFETYFDIVVRLKKVSDLKVEIYDASGKLLYKKEFPDCFCETYHVDMRTFTRGIYIARITSDEETYSTKLFLSK